MYELPGKLLYTTLAHEDILINRHSTGELNPLYKIMHDIRLISKSHESLTLCLQYSSIHSGRSVYTT
jgi:hypothetical protein